MKKQLYQNGANDEFTVKVATTPQEIKALVEVSFEYIMTKETLSYFRKRKWKIVNGCVKKLGNNFASVVLHELEILLPHFSGLD